MAPVETMKFTTDRPYSDPEKAARRLVEHAHAFETMHDGRIHIEKLNGPFLFIDNGSPAEYAAGLADLFASWLMPSLIIGDVELSFIPINLLRLGETSLTRTEIVP